MISKTTSDSFNSGDYDRADHTNCFNAVSYGNGVFVAVGAGGNIFRSTDGSSWGSLSSISVELKGVIYTN